MASRTLPWTASPTPSTEWGPVPHLARVVRLAVAVLATARSADVTRSGRVYASQVPGRRAVLPGLCSMRRGRCSGDAAMLYPCAEPAAGGQCAEALSSYERIVAAEADLRRLRSRRRPANPHPPPPHPPAPDLPTQRGPTQGARYFSARAAALPEKGARYFSGSAAGPPEKVPGTFPVGGRDIGHRGGDPKCAKSGLVTNDRLLTIIRCRPAEIRQQLGGERASLGGAPGSRAAFAGRAEGASPQSPVAPT